MHFKPTTSLSIDKLPSKVSNLRLFCAWYLLSAKNMGHITDLSGLD